MNYSDDISAGIGGTIMAIISAVTLGSILEVMVFAFIGGLVGVFAKKIGEYVWHQFFPKKNKSK